MSDLIERIRRRAYEIWEGNSGGNAEDHWLQAEREILGSAAARPAWKALAPTTIMRPSSAPTAASKKK
jgi:hypothetical protein